MTTPPNAESVNESAVQPPDAVPDETPPRRSPLAITTLVTGLLGIVPLAIAFGIATFVQLKRGTHEGKALAIGGLAAAFTWVAAWTVLIAVIVPTSAPGHADAAENTEGGKVRLSALNEGDCYAGVGPNALQIALVEAAPCDEPHQGEIIAVAPLSAAPKVEGVRQEDATQADQAAPLCVEKAAYLEKSRFLPDLKPHVYVSPGVPGGELKITCAMHYTGSGVLDTRLAETLDPNLTNYATLDVGKCIEDLDDLDYETWPVQIARPVPCTRPHRYQLYANFDVPAFENATWHPRPQEEIEEKADRECAAKAQRMLPRAPAVELELTWLVGKPALGIRNAPVICFVGRLDGAPLKKSIVSK